MDEKLKEIAIGHAKHLIMNFTFNGTEYRIYPTVQHFIPKWEIERFQLCTLDHHGIEMFSEEIKIRG